METISKVKNVQGAGTWDSQYGTLYSFDYEFEDGTVLRANHKTENHFNVGDEVEYKITKENEFGKSGKVSKPQQQKPAGYKGGYNGGGKGSQASFALAYAKDWAGFYISKGVDKTPSDVLEAAEVFNKWLQEN